MRSHFQFGLCWILAIPVIAGAILTGMTAKHEPTALIALWMTMFAQFAMVAVVACSRNRLRIAFGIGAVPPALIGVLVAAKTLLAHPLNWQRSGFESLVYRNLMSGDLAHIEDIRFRVGFLIAATLVCGISGLLAAWLAQTGNERD